MLRTIGYFKTSNTAPFDFFGSVVALSADAQTLAIGAPGEDSGSGQINGDQSDKSQANAGAVYVFVRDDDVWRQQAYIKASNPEAGDGFGTFLVLSADGNTLAVGAPGEDSGAAGVNGSQTDDCEGPLPHGNCHLESGAVYVFARSGQNWAQQAYLKSNNPFGSGFGLSIALSGDGNTLAAGSETSGSLGGAVHTFGRNNGVWTQFLDVARVNVGLGDGFGASLAMSEDGQTLVVGAPSDSSAVPGISLNDVVNDCVSTTPINCAFRSGAVLLFDRTSTIGWTQRAVVKASSPLAGGLFGRALSLSADGSTLAATSDESTGAVQVFANVRIFSRTSSGWQSQAAIGSPYPRDFDNFGASLALSANGDTLVIGAPSEDSGAVGVNGDQLDNSVPDAGAVYVAVRSSNVWELKSYLKTTFPQIGVLFGSSVAVSATAETVAAGAVADNSSAIGVGGNQFDISALHSGAAYLF
jgi:hypothetical protein